VAAVEQQQQQQPATMCPCSGPHSQPRHHQSRMQPCLGPRFHRLQTRGSLIFTAPRRAAVLSLPRPPRLGPRQIACLPRVPRRMPRTPGAPRRLPGGRHHQVRGGPSHRPRDCMQIPKTLRFSWIPALKQCLVHPDTVTLKLCLVYPDTVNLKLCLVHPDTVTLKLCLVHPNTVTLKTVPCPP